MRSSLKNVRIAIFSRCSWTLYNFRRSLAIHLASAGADVTTFGAAGDGYDRHLRACGITFESVPLAMRSMDPLADIRMVLHLILRFRKLRPEIVHCFTIKPAIFGTLAAAFAGVPVRIVTITGLGYAFTTAPTAVRWLIVFLYRMALRRAQLVIFQNAEDKELFMQLGLVDSEQSRLVPGSGVDLSRFTPAPLPCQSAHPASFLMLARLLIEKGVLEYLAAARIVKRLHPEVQIRLLGGEDPRNPSSLSAAEKQELTSSTEVEWVQEVEDVRVYIREADVIVLPSYREGLPRSLLEGAAMGRALIATDATGCREVVEDGTNGYLVKVGDPESLARAMIKCIQNPDAVARMGACARQRAVLRFDERHVLDLTLDHYSQALALR